VFLLGKVRQDTAVGRSKKGRNSRALKKGALKKKSKPSDLCSHSRALKKVALKKRANSVTGFPIGEGTTTTTTTTTTAGRSKKGR
jgi:hypothetical protein